MHEPVLDYIRANRPESVASVAEFGSRDINGTARVCFADVSDYVGVDPVDGPAVDIVGDAASIDLGRLFDVIVCAEVLEHVDDTVAAGIIANAFAHLNDGGVFIATMAGPGRHPHSAVDGKALQPGEFYRNVDKSLLADWITAAGFTVFDIDRTRLDIRCTARKEGAE